jgi:hypothetical protein
MASLTTTSIKHFTSINRALGPTWTETSKRKIHPFSRLDREAFWDWHRSPEEPGNSSAVTVADVVR